MAADTALGRQQITRGQCQFCRSKIWLLLPSPTVEPGVGCNRTLLTGRQAADSFTLSVLVKCDNYTDPSAPSLPSSQKNGIAHHLHFISIPFLHVRERRGSRRSKQGESIPEGFAKARAFSAPHLSMPGDSGHSHRLAWSGCCCFQAFLLFQKTKSARLSPAFCGGGQSLHPISSNRTCSKVAYGIPVTFP